jgi:hypothetical protein
MTTHDCVEKRERKAGSCWSRMEGIQILCQYRNWLFIQNQECLRKMKRYGVLQDLHWSEVGGEEIRLTQILLLRTRNPMTESPYSKL